MQGRRAGRAASPGQRPRPLVDAGFVFALVVLGLVGFRTTFGSATFLVVGMVATALGIGISALSVRLRQSFVVELVLSVVVYYLVAGALADRGDTVGHVVPTGGTLRSLSDLAVTGWKDLLTTVPPVGTTSNLLVIPFIVGLLGGVAGYSLARRTRFAALPLVSPAAVLAISILFGTEIPASLILQGLVFSGVALAWIAIRADQASTRVGSRAPSLRRVGPALGVIVVAAAGAYVVGPHLPFAGSQQRVVLSRYVQPPFDVNAQPSPLTSFRHYTKGAPGSAFATRLFTVTGVPTGTPVTIATLDSYNGLVWGFGGGGSTASTDSFRRFGSTIPAGSDGVVRTVTVHVAGLSGDFLPTVGQPTSYSFSGDNASALLTGLRVNSDTETAADSFGLSTGDDYRFSTVIPVEPSQGALSGAAAGEDDLAVEVPSFVQTDAGKWIDGANGAWQKVMALADYLKAHGKYSDGDESVSLAAPGEDVGRLTSFLDGTPLVGQQIVGDDEQYAATMALMSNAEGVPARVVFGAIVGARGVVTGADVHAWVQVDLAGLGWVTVPSSKFTPTASPDQVQPQPHSVEFSHVAVTPPAISAQQPPLDVLLPNSKSPAAGLQEGAGFQLPAIVITLLKDLGLPLLVLLAAAAVVLALKGSRRRRRQADGPPEARIAAGWRELLDSLADLGIDLPANATRREQAGLVPDPTVSLLAVGADSAAFSPGRPSEDDAVSYWRDVASVRQSMYAAAGRLRRVLAYVNVTSLRKSSRGVSQ